jgi:uncharacterized protein (TIGR00730 family)
VSNINPEIIIELIKQLPQRKHGKWIQRALETLLRITDEEIDRLDWKILSASLSDLEQGFTTFLPYSNIRKIAIFGSARIGEETEEYKLAQNFSHAATKLGFMVLTGGGGGIMEAANLGAGKDNSFGLNIQLPYEQEANPYIDPQKLIDFKYFFTRKLFFLKESDAIALFPGGFGTQDEAFETLTLCQTGKFGPAPLVLIDKPDGDYWHLWQEYIHKQLVKRGFISPEDSGIYSITDNLDIACKIIREFYCVYHSSRYVDRHFVMRLNSELTDAQVKELDREFADILVSGNIEKTKALPQENGDETVNLPRLIFNFDRSKMGRLYQLIHRINDLGLSCAANINEHPELKR